MGHNTQNQFANQQQGRQNPSSQFKRYNNWNYYFSCGFYVEDWHHSGTCQTLHWNHNATATITNTLGGSQKGQYRTSLPQQSTPYDK